MSQYGNYTNDLNTPTKMKAYQDLLDESELPKSKAKKILAFLKGFGIVIATIFFFPIVLAGIILSIPTRAFIEGYKLGNNMIDSGKI
jgi:hypothetical protein